MPRPRTKLKISLLLAVGLVCPAAGAAKVDLSPTAWPQGDLERYTALHNVTQRAHPPVKSRQGIVVGTTAALAVRSGVEALRQGGSAADAALTTALAQVTLNGGSTVSFAGKFHMVYYEAASGEISYLNGGWGVPAGQESGADIPACGIPSGKQVLVPGFMASVEAAHQRFGRLPFAAIFGPARYFARRGFEIPPMLGSWIQARESVLTRLPGGRAIFLKPDGSLYRTGDWFRQPALDRTLRAVSRKGARYMYTGPWARKLARIVQSEGGRLTAADLAAYRALWIEPLTFEWDGFEIHAPGPPASGGINMRDGMIGLSASALRAAGPYTESPDALSELLAAVERRYFPSSSAGGSHSDSIIAIDSTGDVAAILHTINTRLWGGTGIFVNGVSISDMACWASLVIGLVGPGGRLAGTANPLIVTRNGRPVAASSAVGSAIFETTLFSLVNVLTYGRTPQRAVDTPTFHLPELAGTTLLHRAIAGQFRPDLLEAVRNRGFRIEALPEPYINKGWWIGASIRPRSGRMLGATADAWNGLAERQ